MCGANGSRAHTKIVRVHLYAYVHIYEEIEHKTYTNRVGEWVSEWANKQTNETKRTETDNVESLWNEKHQA